MTNAFHPFGFSEVGYLLGAKPRGASYDFPMNSGNGSSYGSGEPVALVNGSPNQVFPATAYPPAQFEEVICGIFQSVTYRPSQPGSPVATFPTWVSGTTIYNGGSGTYSLNVDPFVIYNIQSNGSLTMNDIGANFNIAGMDNLDSNGNSQVYLNSSPLANSYWGQVKVIGLAPETPSMQVQGGNNWGDAYTIVQVVINNSLFKLGTYGASVI